jgi:PAS domain S-box-containing protein
MRCGDRESGAAGTAGTDARVLTGDATAGSPGLRAAQAAALDSLPAAAVLIADRDQRIQQVEGEAFARHGLRTEDWTGRSLTDVLPAEALPLLAPHYRAALAGETRSFDYWTVDGTRAYWVQIAPLRGPGGEIGSVVAIMQDITDRLRVTADLARSEARLRDAERMVGVGSWELVMDTGQFTFSTGFATLLGLREGEPLDVEGLRARVHPEDQAILEQAEIQYRRLGSATFEYRIIRPDGTSRTLAVRAEAFPGPDGRPHYVRGAALDVTEQRKAERERLMAESVFRQGFDAAPIGMALSDPVRGRYLRVNEALCRLLGRSREDLLGRTVDSVTHPADRDSVHVARQMIHDGMTDSFQSEKRYTRPDGSVVWALLHMTPVWRPEGSVEAFHSQVVDITDRKEREARLEHDVGDALWLARIRDALDQERLLLYAQPIVDLWTGQTVQREVLLRMLGDDGTIVGPEEFLPVAERYGLISEIDRWVIRKAVAIAATGVPTEFNLSGRSIGDPSILRELATAIAATGADPSLLVVEVTETAIMDRIEAGRVFAEKVRGLGCRLALDDFGTGFGGLTYLKHFSADHLKIDIDFVRELASSSTDERVVRGIVGLAREFNQTTIAEGVEDEATLLRLRDLGVDLGQGFLFGPPVPASSAALEPSGPVQPVSPGCEDSIAVVRELFAAFAARDLDGMLRQCIPEVVLRLFATPELAARDAPYRGEDGLRTYLRDVSEVWDELTVTPLTLRQARESVIAFGHAHGRRGAQCEIDSVLWVVRMRGPKIASIEVFQDPRGQGADSSAFAAPRPAPTRPKRDSAGRDET